MVKNSEFNQEIELIMTGKKHLSFSALKSFLQSPKHFFVYKTDKQTTKAMDEGSIFHMACLEPDKFKESFWVLDDTDKCKEIGGAKPRATKIYGEWVADQQALNKGKEMLSKADYDTYLSMSNYLYECSATKDLMNGLIAKEEPFDLIYDGFLIKGKVDGRGSDYIIDLKKVANASYKKVRWLLDDESYDLQGSLYCLKHQVNNYYLIFIDESCNVSVVKFSLLTLERGINKLEVALQEFTRCAEENGWNSSYEFFINDKYIEV